MNYVNFTPIIDVSSIIWDINDFNLNEPKYHKLKADVTGLFCVLENKGLKFLLRKNLINEIRGGFPIYALPPDFSALNEIVQSFFANITIIEYSDLVDPSIQSIPDLKKSFYEISTKEEICHLVSRIHTGDEIEKIYFTFEMLWTRGSKLVTLDSASNQFEHNTIISDDATKIEKTLERFELKFEHHTKHERIRGYYEAGGELISPFSCYDGVSNAAQKLLNDAIKFEDNYFNFDEDYEVYVRFIKTKDNIYHAHDISDEKELPPEIISKFGKSVTRGKGIDGTGKWIGK